MWKIKEQSSLFPITKKQSALSRAFCFFLKQSTYRSGTPFINQRFNKGLAKMY